GKGMRAIFCDSLEVRGNIFWSDDFLAEFKRRRGYDLQPFLPVLQVQRANLPYARFYEMPFFDIKDIGDQVRHDYRLTVAELMTERFYSQFNRWAHDHNLLSRTQAHGAPVDVLRVYKRPTSRRPNSSTTKAATTSSSSPPQLRTSTAAPSSAASPSSGPTRPTKPPQKR